MPHCFFDTSALVRRYYEENGSEVVDAIIEDADTTVVITSLAVIEAVSAVRRKYNTDEITEDVMYSLIAAFFREALDEFVILPMEEVAFERSFDLVVQNDLRTLDALQLSAALSVAHDDLRFVCADRELVAVADRLGLTTMDPSEISDP
jgi:predicted nucleic acid-binding protein